MNTFKINFKDVKLKDRLKSLHIGYLIFIVLTYLFLIAIQSNISVYILVSIFSLLNYLRQRKWHKYLILSIKADDEGVDLKFMDGDKIKECKLDWGNINIKKHLAFSKTPINYLSIRHKDKLILRFYSDVTNEVTFETINKISERLKKLKVIYEA